MSLLKKTVTRMALILQCMINGIPDAQTFLEALPRDTRKAFAVSDSAASQHGTHMNENGSITIPVEESVVAAADTEQNNRNAILPTLPETAAPVPVVSGHDTIIHPEKSLSADTVNSTMTTDNSGYYYRYPLSRGAVQETPPTTVNTGRKPLRTPPPPDRKNARDTIQNTPVTAVNTLETAIPADNLQKGYRLTGTAKTAIAIGSTVIIGGIVTYIIYEKYREDAAENTANIPLPPDPPGR